MNTITNLRGGSSSLDEKALIEGLINSDDKAFDKLIDLYGNNILRLCYMRTSQMEVAEDLTQETLIGIFKYIGKFKGKSSLKTWVYKIAINNCNKYQTKLAKEKVTVTYVDFSDEGEKIIVEQDSEIDEYLKESNKEIIFEGLSIINYKYREVIYMFYYDELSVKDIGSILNKNENTIKTLLRRGRSELAKVLRKEDLYA